MKGTIYRSTGSWYQVKDAFGQLVDCRLKGKFKVDNLKLTNPLAVGDIVQFNIEDGQTTGIISEIEKRDNYIIRPSPRNPNLDHIIASNIDQSVLVISMTSPRTPLGFIDRFLLVGEMYKIPSVIVFNKIDIYKEKHLEQKRMLVELYDSLGYITAETSVNQMDGIDDLKNKLKNKINLFSGQSGVGKSSLLNALYPKLDLEVGEISNFNSKGTHTTTFATMIDVEDSTIIDTPGIKQIGITNIEPEEVGDYFREWQKFSNDCRFQDCKHHKEPSCGIKKALKEGLISKTRYKNYLSILDDIESVNYWKRR